METRLSPFIIALSSLANSGSANRALPDTFDVRRDGGVDFSPAMRVAFRTVLDVWTEVAVHNNR